MSGKPAADTRVLVVDDEPDFRNALAYSLKRLGYQCVTASGGKEAFGLICERAFDVVISDIQMPGGNGVELLDRTRELSPEMPVILLITGFSDLSTEEAHNKGAEALFSKPFDRKVLTDAIQRLLTCREERWRQPIGEIALQLSSRIRFQGLPAAIEAKVLSLGRGGMFVSLPLGQYPNVSDEVGFNIVFDDTGRFLDGSGVIRWIRTKNAAEFPSGCGIEFTYLGESQRKQVLDYIQDNLPKAFIPAR